MLHKKLLFIATMALAVIVCSCTKQGDFNQQETIADQLTNKVVKIATFGEQTGHPFSMENVIEAYNNLPTKAAFSESAQDILPTHLYVRFITSNLDEIDAIQKNKDFDYYQYPLDCEITDGFVGVDNPFLINGFPQYWCVVPIDYNLDKIACPYEIESELWMPSFLEDVNTKSIGNNVSRAFEEALFEELCHEHNLGEPEFTQTKSRTSYYPGGYVKYVDTELGTVGLEHIKVEAFNFWHNYKTYSTSTGYLTYGSHYFTGSFKYRVKFKSDEFEVKIADTHVELEYVTGSTTSTLYQVFTGEYATFSVIFQATQRYYYQDIDIPIPPTNGFWDACLRVCVYPTSSSPDEWMGCFTQDDRWLLADRPLVYVWGYGSSGPFTSPQLYGTTIHELTHAMHYKLNKTLYPSIESRVKESLARGVQLYLTTQRYPSYGSLYYCFNRYTGIMRDLTDGVKTVYCYYYEDSTGTPHLYTTPISYYDSINSAYTYAELVEAVKTCVTPEDWEDRIKELYPGRVLNSTLHNAFDFWFDL